MSIQDQQSIRTLSLNPKVLKQLTKLGILTLGDLTSKTEAEFRKCQGVGPLTVSQVITALEDRALTFKDFVKDEPLKRAAQKTASDLIRDLKLTELILQGKSLQQTGEALGITYSASVQRTCMRCIAIMRHPSRLDEPLPEGDHSTLSSIRKNADFWLRRLALLRSEIHQS